MPQYLVARRSTSIAEIAERCGLSQPGVLHYFPNKAVLLSAALEPESIDISRI
ncbi:helix-turn-helix domain-containing protein [Nocardia sp. NPDC004582]